MQEHDYAKDIATIRVLLCTSSWTQVLNPPTSASHGLWLGACASNPKGTHGCYNKDSTARTEVQHSSHSGAEGWRHLWERDEEAGYWELLQKMFWFALEMEGSGVSMIPRCLQEPHFWGREMYSSPLSTRHRCKQNIRNTPASSISHCQHLLSHLPLTPSCSVFTAQPPKCVDCYILRLHDTWIAP